MTGQAYSARSEPNYRQWGLGALFALGLIGSLWHACREPSKPAPPEAAALEEPPRPVPRFGASPEELRDQLTRANSRLTQAQETLEVAGRKIGRLNDQLARFRREAEARGDVFPPPELDVRHIGGRVFKSRGGNAWEVDGEWFNLGEIKADGMAELQLRVGGRLVGEVHKVRVGPIAPGGRFRYSATLPRVSGDEAGPYVDVKAVWSQL